MIYRIADAEDWRLACRTGRFVSADLDREGFIHASERDQVLATAERRFRGKAGLVLLEIDDAQLAGMVIREDLTGSGRKFPHVYGPIPLHAIVRHFDFRERDGRGFALPAELSG